MIPSRADTPELSFRTVDLCADLTEHLAESWANLGLASVALQYLLESRDLTAAETALVLAAITQLAQMRSELMATLDHRLQPLLSRCDEVRELAGEVFATV